VTRKIIDHIADVRLRVEAASLDELFSEAARGMYEIMQVRGGGEAVQREFTLDAPDTTTLLVDFLNEVLSRAHIRREVFDSIRFLSLSATALHADLSGRGAAEFDHDIKAVTYHEADVQRTNGLWTTTLVFDI
jgi:SHS2 domain-containing protein